MRHHHRDHEYMQEAMRIGQTSLGRSSPNPAVGAVIVRDAEIIGRGASCPVGRAHAEIIALREAGARAEGATIYVTLEPCCHHGRTPPCTDSLIVAGISRCVVAMEDPFPSVAGSGITRLREADIVVDVGVGADDAAVLHAGFLTRIRTGRPLVHAKYAMTLDGHIATRTGDSRWITGTAARQHVHLLRDRTDAILVGAGTVCADDPALTTRLPDDLAGYGGPHHPLRVIVDGRGVSPLQSRVFKPDLPGLTLVATSEQADPQGRSALEQRGIETLTCGSGPRVDLGALLDLLGDRGVNELLVEGGGQVLGSFFDAGLVDRVSAFVAPVIIGGVTAPVPVGGRGCERLAAAWRVISPRVTSLDGDLLVEGAVVAGSLESEVA